MSPGYAGGSEAPHPEDANGPEPTSRAEIMARNQSKPQIFQDPLMKYCSETRTGVQIQGFHVMVVGILLNEELSEDLGPFSGEGPWSGLGMLRSRALT